MARFDVYRGAAPSELWLDCQSDHLSHLSHRFIVPLVEPYDAPSSPISRLNPMLVVAGVRYVMLTQFAAAVPTRDLGERIATLSDDDHRVIDALDTLIGTA